MLSTHVSIKGLYVSIIKKVVITVFMSLNINTPIEDADIFGDVVPPVHRLAVDKSLSLTVQEIIRLHEYHTRI